MDDATARALNELNLAFYRERAGEFSAKRQRPWRGWTRLLDWLPERRLSVLDVGCGNARFARFLATHGRLGRYTGVDASEPLLAIARAAAPAGGDCRFERADFVAVAPERALPPERVDLVALFGVLHGVPGRERRRALLATAAARLAPDGLLVFSCWRFAEDARLAGRILPWERAPLDLDAAQLDAGDHLLPWGDDPDTLRYSASVGSEERAALLADLPVEPVASYREDGPGGDKNHYTVARRRPRAEPRR